MPKNGTVPTATWPSSQCVFLRFNLANRQQTLCLHWSIFFLLIIIADWAEWIRGNGNKTIVSFDFLFYFLLHTRRLVRSFAGSPLAMVNERWMCACCETLAWVAFEIFTSASDSLQGEKNLWNPIFSVINFSTGSLCISFCHRETAKLSGIILVFK